VRRGSMHAAHGTVTAPSDSPGVANGQCGAPAVGLSDFPVLHFAISIRKALFNIENKGGAGIKDNAPPAG